MSTAWPSAPPCGWWSSTRECGSANRLPGAPASSSTAAALAAWPMTIVETARLDVLHRVVDREQRRDDAAGRVDVQADVLVGVLGLEVQQLGHDQVADVVVDRRAQEHDALLEQAGVDVGERSPRLVCSTTYGTVAVGDRVVASQVTHRRLLVRLPRSAAAASAASSVMSARSTSRSRALPLMISPASVTICPLRSSWVASSFGSRS